MEIIQHLNYKRVDQLGSCLF